MSADNPRKIRCAFIRGGSSKGLFFTADDLPDEQQQRDRIFLSLMGSPDAYGRQLNGMGGGISSLSKVAIVEPCNDARADISYTFGQVAVDRALVDYSANCGNLSSAVAPFALDEGMLVLNDGRACVRVLNTNTDKVFDCHFEVVNGRAREAGDLVIPGISGSGAGIRLIYPDPAGSATGKLLPTGQLIDQLSVPGLGQVEVSLVDASNAVVFVAAERLGCSGFELPGEIDANGRLMQQLEVIRQQAAVLMGLVSDPKSTPIGSPKIAMIASPGKSESLSGESLSASDYHLSMRMISVGKAHKVVTLTGAMCAAVAAKLKGSLVHRYASAHQCLSIGTPSGVLPVEAEVVRRDSGDWQVRQVTSWRTQRRLMDGYAWLPE